MNDFRSLIESVANASLHYLPLFLAVSFILVKLALIRFSGHKEDQWRALLGIPEDISYGALALIIAGLSGDIPAFTTFFTKSDHPSTDIWILFWINVGICYAVHMIHQHLVLPQYEGWRAADELLEEQEQRQRPNPAAVRGYTLVYFGKFGAMIGLLILEGGIAIWWIMHIADIIESH